MNPALSVHRPLFPGLPLLVGLALFLLLALLPGLVVSPARAAIDPRGKAASDRMAVAEQFREAKDYYYRLERDPELGDRRENWVDGVRRFRRLYIAHPDDPVNPHCLYMMARMHERMYRRFHKKQDLDDALLYYQDVVRIFSRHALADDALFAEAELLLLEKKDTAGARRLLERIVKEYPKGDRRGEAVGRLHQIDGTAGSFVQAEARKRGERPADRQPAPPARSVTKEKVPGNLVPVLPVKYWSSPDYTRVAIRADKPVRFKSRLLEERDGKPRRLYIDFYGAYIPPRYRTPIPIKDGLLQQVRSGQFDDSTVRVVLDIESISDYKVFSLQDPFRVVIDVWGKKGVRRRHLSTASRPKPAAPRRQEPPPSTTKARQPSSSEGPRPPETRPLAAEIPVLCDQKKMKPGETARKPPAPAAIGGPSYSLAQQLGLGVRRIVIDPGHGGKDPGALANGLREKDIVLQVARKVKARLEKKYGYEVLLTRSGDVFLELEERTAIANTRRADLFVSIHVNAHPKPGPRGIETFFLNLATNDEAMRVAARENATSKHNISELQDILKSLMRNTKIQESSRLASYVQTSLVDGLSQARYPVKDLGVKQAPFYVLIGAQMPAVLTEISFITNPDEARLLKQPRYLDHIAESIAAGVVQYVNSTSTASALP